MSWWPFSKRRSFKCASAAAYVKTLTEPLKQEAARDATEDRKQAIRPPAFAAPPTVDGYAAAPARAVRNIACLVTHGMGQQVPFETIGELMESLSRHVGMANAQPQINRVRLGDDQDPVTRMEVFLAGTGGKPDIRLHVYEGYWAPLTEGKVTFLEATTFLLSGAWTGLLASARGKKFARWVFGEIHEFPIKPGTFWDLLITVSFLLVGLGLFYWFQEKLKAASRAISLWNRHHSNLGTYLWQCARQIGSTLASWFATLFHHPITAAGSLLHGLAQTFVDLRHLLLVGLVLALGAGYLYLLNFFMVQFVGDVAIYISSHKVNKFEEVRTAVQKKIFDVASQIYSAKGNTGEKLYDRIILVGHSLGSVVSYDLLNQLIAWDRACHAGDIRVVRRTTRLITFGSPLDKTAFLFRMQVSANHHYREAMAAQEQPLILDYELRPKTFEWVNIYSWADVVSGHLIYYDLPARVKHPGGRAAENRVRNIHAPEAWVPLYAHVQYWGGETLRQELWKAVTAP